MRLTLDSLMLMKSQGVGCNKDLIKEFAEVRKELLKKGFKKIFFEETTDRKSRLWFESRKLLAYDAEKDEALLYDVAFGGFPFWARSNLLNINRLVVIKSIAEYVLSVAQGGGTSCQDSKKYLTEIEKKFQTKFGSTVLHIEKL